MSNVIFRTAEFTRVRSVIYIPKMYIKIMGARGPRGFIFEDCRYNLRKVLIVLSDHSAICVSNHFPYPRRTQLTLQ